jgi:hypothetical protein
MDERDIRQALHSQAEQEIPEDMNLWPTIQKQLEKPAPRRARPALRLGKAAVGVAAAALVSAVGYAYYQSRMDDPGLQAVDNADMVTHLNLSQTIDGMTVTVDYAYADANRISISYSASGNVPVASSYVFGDVKFTDDRGHAFRDLLSGGGGGGGGGGGPEATEMQVMFNANGSYDATVIQDAPDKLNLRLEITLAQMNDGWLLPNGTTVPNTNGLPDPNAQSVSVPAGKQVGPYIFNFTIPFNKGRTLSEPKTAESNGIALTLRRFVVTPSMTRAELCFNLPIPADLKPRYPDVPLTWAIVGRLQVDDQTLDIPLTNDTSLTTGAAPEANCHAYPIAQAALKSASNADWKLTITRLEIPGSEDAEKVNAALRAAGFTLIPQPNGGYGIEKPENMEYDTFIKQVDAITEQFRYQVDGPWTFTFRLP